MTKKDYDRAAAIIRARLGNEKAELVYTFCEFFRGDNPRFDETRFVQACEETQAKPKNRKVDS